VLTYQERLERHLSSYRRDRLGVARCGTFRHKGVERVYGHILPRELRWLNIPEAFRAEIRAYISANPRIQLHRYFHHLNSSQAFALNLFYPYLTLDKPTLSKALGISPIERGSFEEIPEPGEGTNVDVLLVVENDVPLYCEVKLSETGFGTAPVDARHRKKVEKVYRPTLLGHVDSSLLDPEVFCASYQILRNLWLAAKNPVGSVLFLLPKGNTALSAKLSHVLSRADPELRARTRVVFMEDVLKALAAASSEGRGLSWYAAMLREKYVPSAAT